VARGHARGRKIESPVGVLEHVLRSGQKMARLTCDPASERKNRIKEKEAKYEDIYLS
jgi:hypothetical protein